MAINSTTDIVKALIQLGKQDNSYELNQSVPPHAITKWDSGNSDSQPTDDELNTAYTSWKTANDYKKKREEAYPSWQQQMDLQYWDQVNGTTKWKEAIAKVKSDNPKP